MWISSDSPPAGCRAGLGRGRNSRPRGFSKAGMFWIGRQVGRARRELLRVLADFLHHQLDGFFQLRVVARHHLVGAVIHDDVGLDAAILYEPPAVEAVERKLWPRDVAAVHQGNSSIISPRT